MLVQIMKETLAMDLNIIFYKNSCYELPWIDYLYTLLIFVLNICLYTNILNHFKKYNCRRDRQGTVGKQTIFRSFAVLLVSRLLTSTDALSSACNQKLIQNLDKELKKASDEYTILCLMNLSRTLINFIPSILGKIDERDTYGEADIEEERERERERVERKE